LQIKQENLETFCSYQLRFQKFYYNTSRASKHQNALTINFSDQILHETVENDKHPDKLSFAAMHTFRVNQFLNKEKQRNNLRLLNTRRVVSEATN